MNEAVNFVIEDGIDQLFPKKAIDVMVSQLTGFDKINTSDGVIKQLRSVVDTALPLINPLVMTVMT